METIEAECQKATQDKILPAVMLAAASADGSLKYIRHFGNLDADAGSPPVSEDSTVCLASATKLLTCVAAMQVVERGFIALDSDISSVLPQWKDAMVLKGFDDSNGGNAILETAQNKITMRRLLSHTSGITSLENESLQKYLHSIGDRKATLIMRYFGPGEPEAKAQALEEIRKGMGDLEVVPLAFEPGTTWAYGQGTDWAGQAHVERLTNMTLEHYCQENIFKPLGMTHTTYRLLDHAEVLQNLVKMTNRNEDGTVSNAESIYPLDPKVDMAPNDLRVDRCLAGLVNLHDLNGGRKAGSVTWAGATCCYWWIDREAGLCGFYGSQVMGAGDKRVSRGYCEKFERALYATRQSPV